MPRPRPTWLVRSRARTGVVAALLVLAMIAPAGASALPWAGVSDHGGAGGVFVESLTDAPSGVELVVSSGVAELSEAGHAANLTVRLAAAPDRVVTVTLLADVPTTTRDRQVRATTTSSSLEFGPDSWSQPRPFSIRAIDDDVAEASPHVAHVTLAVIGADAEVLTSTPVQVRIEDNDTAQVIVQPTDGANVVKEGGASDAIDIRLATRPRADVTVKVELGGQLVASAPELTFTESDWSSMQTLRIGALQDPAVEGDLSDVVRFSLRSDDPLYAGAVVPDAQPVRVLDDDAAGVGVTPSGAETRVAENGNGDDYVVKLLARPTSTVRVQVQPAEDVAVSPMSLEFAPDAWQTPQQVTVTAVDDKVAEQRVENVAIRHVVDGDQYWAGLPAPVVHVAVADDDARAAADEGGEEWGEHGGGGADVGSTDEGGEKRRLSGALTGGLAAGGSSQAPSRPRPATARAARAASAVLGDDDAGLDVSKLGRARTVRPVNARNRTARGSERPVATSLAARQERAKVARAEPPVSAHGSWYARNWKMTVPATVVGALGLVGTLFVLMSDPSQVGRRRLW